MWCWPKSCTWVIMWRRTSEGRVSKVGGFGSAVGSILTGGEGEELGKAGERDRGMYGKRISLQVEALEWIWCRFLKMNSSTAKTK